MKFLLLFMFVAVALANQGSIFDVSQDEIARNMANMFRIEPKDSLECIKKTEVIIEDIIYMAFVIDSLEMEPTFMKSLERASCAMVCCAQKRGIIVKGEIVEEQLFMIYQNSTMPEEMQMSLQNSTHICKEQVTDTSDECMAGFEFAKCLYNRTKSVVQHK